MGFFFFQGGGYAKYQTYQNSVSCSKELHNTGNWKRMFKNSHCVSSRRLLLCAGFHPFNDSDLCQEFALNLIEHAFLFVSELRGVVQ